MKEPLWKVCLIGLLLSVLIFSFFIHNEDVRTKQQEPPTEQTHQGITWELVQNSVDKNGITVQFYILPIDIQHDLTTDEVRVVLKRTISRSTYMHSEDISDYGIADMFCASGIYRIGFYKANADHHGYMIDWSPMSKVVVSTPSQVLETLLCSIRA